MAKPKKDKTIFYALLSMVGLIVIVVIVQKVSLLQGKTVQYYPVPRMETNQGPSSSDDSLALNSTGNQGEHTMTNSNTSDTINTTQITEGSANVAIDFDSSTDLFLVTVSLDYAPQKGSKIELINKGTDYGDGEVEIEMENHLMKRALNKDAPNGEYTVKYSALKENGDIQTGSLTLHFTRTKQQELANSTNRTNVSINQSQTVGNQDISIQSNIHSNSSHNSYSVQRFSSHSQSAIKDTEQ